MFLPALWAPGCGVSELRFHGHVQEAVLSVEPEPSFAKRFPVFDGVCMGNRKACKCGAPFLG